MHEGDLFPAAPLDQERSEDRDERHAWAAALFDGMATDTVPEIHAP